MMHWFEYAIIRYLPNPKRGEILNIGLIIFRASGVDVRLLNNPSKLRMIDGESLAQDLARLEQSIKGICSFADNSYEQCKLINDFAGGVSLSGVASFSIENIQQYERAVNRLFDSLVKPLSTREPRGFKSRLHTQIKKQLERFDLLANDPSEISEHKVVASYLLGSNSGLHADFMLKNGRYHMSETIDFDVNDLNSKFKETSLKVMTFLEGKRLLDENMGCYLIYNASSQKEREVTSHLNLASDYSDILFNFASGTDKAAYFQLLSDLVGRELPLS